uniref:Uncharacterized protein n=1 Tax=Anguilla anguilla TaxID=7936 RepID=A0A0E9W6C9_ANGAN
MFIVPQGRKKQDGKSHCWVSSQFSGTAANCLGDYSCQLVLFLKVLQETSCCNVLCFQCFRRCLCFVDFFLRAFCIKSIL